MKGCAWVLIGAFMLLFGALWCYNSQRQENARKPAIEQQQKELLKKYRQAEDERKAQEAAALKQAETERLAKQQQEEARRKAEYEAKQRETEKQARDRELMRQNEEARKKAEAEKAALEAAKTSANSRRQFAVAAYKAAVKENAKEYAPDRFEAANVLWTKAKKQAGNAQSPDEFQKAESFFAEAETAYRNCATVAQNKKAELEAAKREKERLAAEQLRLEREERERLQKFAQYSTVEDAIMRKNLRGRWAGTTKYGTGGVDVDMRYEYAFNADGTVQMKDIMSIQSSRTTASSGTWTVTGKGKVLKIHVTSGQEAGRTLVFNLMERSQDSIEFRWDLDCLRNSASHKNFTNTRYWYDSSGIYHFEGDSKSGWSTYHVVNTETPRIMRRVRLW